MLQTGLELDAVKDTELLPQSTTSRRGPLKRPRSLRVLGLCLTLWWKRKDVDYVVKQLRGVGLQDGRAARLCVGTSAGFSGRGSMYVERFSELKAYREVVEALSLFRSRKTVVGYCFLTLSDVVMTSDSARDEILSIGIVPLMFDVMKEHYESVDVQEYGFFLLLKLTRGLPAVKRAEIVNQGALDIIVRAGERHIKREELVIVALACMNVLLLRNDTVKLSNSTLDALVEFLLRVVRHWRRSDKVIVCVNGAAFPILAPAREAKVRALQTLFEELPMLASTTEAPRFSLD